MDWARNVEKHLVLRQAQGPQGSRNETEKAVVESLYESVKAFTEDNPQNDDITIVSLKLGVNS